MKLKYIKLVIDEEINYHKSDEAQKVEINKDYRKGFLAGLKQAKESLVLAARELKEKS